MRRGRREGGKEGGKGEGREGGMANTEAFDPPIIYPTLPSFSPSLPPSSRYFDDDSIDLCRRLLEKDPHKRLGARGGSEVMAHPWFYPGGACGWDAFLADVAPPPFLPNQDINAASQSAIGSFSDEAHYRKVRIEEADQEVYEGWDWVSLPSFFAEVVMFLKAEEVQGPITPPRSSEGCCTIA